MDGFSATPVELQVCGSLLADLSREVHEQMQILKREVEALLGNTGRDYDRTDDSSAEFLHGLGVEL